ncbi:MAG: hypothetical protein RR365_06475, partial [Bacteroides sp.]
CKAMRLELFLRRWSVKSMLYPIKRRIAFFLSATSCSAAPRASRGAVLYNRGDKNRHNCYACHIGGNNRGKAGLERY